LGTIQDAEYLSYHADLTPAERRQQLAEILARGLLRHLRKICEQARQDSAESASPSLDVHTESRLNVRGG
jgi:hypothetical protein